jgi:Autographiviridae endonuclease VII
MRTLFDLAPLQSTSEPVKECGRCRTIKPVGSFSPDAHRKGGLSYSCKRCNADMATIKAEKRKTNFVARPQTGSFRCCLCKATKGVSEFHTDRRRKYGLANWCKACGKVRSKERRDRLRAEGRLTQLNRNFTIRKKIGLEGYNQMVEEQNDLCAICKQKPFVKPRLGYSTNTSKPLFIDHCHKTGKVRGLLCLHCNNGIGYFKDDINRLQSAIDYLLKHAPTTSAAQRTS